MSTIDIARNYIRAAQTGDQALLAATVSPSVVWHQPGANRFSGTHQGLAAVGAMIGGMMEVSQGTFAITEARHYMENGNWVAVSIRFCGDREGASLDQVGMDLLRIQDGKVAEVFLFSSDPAQEDRFWGQ
ncbi:MAG: nuclear transport factor 2 family protein [Pseudomonadota bacterium]